MCVTISQLLEQSAKYLRSHGVENNIVLDAQLILCHVLGKDRLYLTINRDLVLDAQVVKDYQSLLKRRAEGLPLQYITGNQEFMSLSFKVTTDVLIPRADTETLVEFVIDKYIKEPQNSAARMMDIGTGSGCIAVSLAYYIKNSSVYALDVSPKALAIACDNAEANEVGYKVSFIQQDILKGFPEQIEPCMDAIVSNPPYIKTNIIETLQREVKECEPHLALDGGADGLVFYRAIITKAHLYLKPSGLLAFEVGHDQSEEVMKLIEETGKYGDIEIVKDLAGINRVVAARRI